MTSSENIEYEREYALESTAKLQSTDWDSCLTTQKKLFEKEKQYKTRVLDHTTPVVSCSSESIKFKLNLSQYCDHISAFFENSDDYNNDNDENNNDNDYNDIIKVCSILFCTFRFFFCCEIS